MMAMNDKMIRIMQRGLKSILDLSQSKRITYEFPLDAELLAPLIRMTPLSWGASKEKIEEALAYGYSSHYNRL